MALAESPHIDSSGAGVEWTPELLAIRNEVAGQSLWSWKDYETHHGVFSPTDEQRERELIERAQAVVEPSSLPARAVLYLVNES